MTILTTGSPATKAAFAFAAWSYFHLQHDDVILRKKVWFASVVIRVRDLRVLFEAMFGPDPTALPEAGGD